MINGVIQVTKLAGSWGIGTMVGYAAKCFTPPNAGKFTNICTTIAAFGIGLAVEDRVEESVDKFIKECRNLKDDIKNIKKEVKKEQEEKSKKEQA